MGKPGQADELTTNETGWGLILSFWRPVLHRSMAFSLGLALQLACGSFGGTVFHFFLLRSSRVAARNGVDRMVMVMGTGLGAVIGSNPCHLVLLPHLDR